MAGKQKAVAAGLGIGAGLLLALAFTRRGEAMPKKAKAAPRRKPNANQTRAVALAVKYGNTFKIPPSLLIAIMQIESSNNPQAVNMKNPRGGAWGLTQMTLATAQDLTKRFPAVAKKYWPKFDGTGPSLLDPETNVAIGAFHASLLWKRYKDKPGNWLTAGLAWHQGSGNVDRFIEEGGGKINPAKLPPNGKIVFQRLLRQIETNPVVAKAIEQERASGKFAYA